MEIESQQTEEKEKLNISPTETVHGLITVSKLDSTSNSTPLVWVIFGWTNSSTSELREYATFYHKLGIPFVLYLSTPMLTLGWSESGVQKVVEDVLNIITKEAPSSSVILQFMSDGGGVHHYALMDILKDGTFPDFFEKQLIGTAFDSAPSPNDPKLFASGLTHPSDFNNLGIFAPLARGLKKGAIYTTMGLPMITSATTRAKFYPKCVEEDPLLVPQLFIWSRTDKLIPEQHITKIIGARGKKLGDKKVVEWILDDSPHVGHLQTDPEGYAKTVKTFLQLAQSTQVVSVTPLF